jgi:hypothetical protein
LKTICCIVDEQLVVFLGEQFVVLVVVFACVVIIGKFYSIFYSSREERVYFSHSGHD